MKKLAPFLVCLFLSISTFAQVGINTTEPTQTLDINGTLRVRGIKSSQDNLNGPEAIRIVGIDDEGNMVEVDVADNIILENNQLYAINNKEKISDPFPINVPLISNVNLIIWPGEPNDDKSVIRITSLLGDTAITGIVAGQPGQVISLYPTDGDLYIYPNSILSLLSSQILSDTNTVIVVKRYEMIQLMYDGTFNKWVVKSK